MDTNEIADTIAIIKEEMEQPVSDNGYRVNGEHFEIGGKIHTTDYYYAKRYFQKQENSSTLAKILVAKSEEFGLSFEDTTLIGYGSYSRLFLSEMCKEINEKFNHTPNYGLIDAYENGYVFLFEPEVKKNVIILLSITCTFDSFHGIRKFIEEKHRESRVNVTFVSVFFIKDKRLNNGPINSFENEKEVIELYSSFNWSNIDTDQKKIWLDKNGETAVCFYLIELTTTVYLSKTCKWCHPEIHNLTVGEEKPLFPTHSNHDTPAYIFGSPKFSTPDKSDTKPTYKFDEVINLNDKLNPFLAGYFKADDSVFINYIKTDIFYKKNPTKILNFFSGHLENLFSTSNKKVTGKSVVFITPIHLKSSTFLEDLIHKEPLSDYTISILHYQPAVEFVENFIYLYRKILIDASWIFYFDDFISNGETFKMISDYLKHAKSSGNNGIAIDEVEGFDALLTFVDSTTTFNKNEILRKLVFHKEGRSGAGKFLAFHRLHMNHVDNIHLGDPIKEREILLRKILKDCHLDALKSIVIKEIAKTKIKTFDNAETDYTETLKYFPFSEQSDLSNGDISNDYYEKYTNQRIGLIKLKVFHDLAESFSEMTPTDDPQKCYLFLRGVITKLTTKDNLSSYFDMSASDERNGGQEKDIIEDIIIKTLCRSPFKFYVSIFQATFKYNLERLVDINTNLITSTEGHTKLTSNSFNQFRRLKFHIRRSVELNSNFITSRYFLENLRANFKEDGDYISQYNQKSAELIKKFESFDVNDPSLTKKDTDNIYVGLKNIKYKKQQVKSYRYFLLNCYKELIMKNPTRSFRLEQLLNSEDLKPTVILNVNSVPLDQLLTDPFYQLSRILRIENIYHINKFKEFHLDKINASNIDKELAMSVTELKRKYFIDEINDIPNKNVKTLLEYSANAKASDGLPNESNSIITMLKTCMLLKKHESGKHHEGQPDPNVERGFKTEINKILRMVCNIMERDSTASQELDYCFFMKYRDRENEDKTDHIFTILSNDSEDLDDGKLIKISKDGLILNMLNGLLDSEDGNVQTFIGLAKQDEKIHAFQKQYIKAKSKSATKNPTSSELNEEKATISDNEAETWERLDVSEALKKDCSDGKYGLNMITDAKMVLLFRLATIEETEDGGVLNGEAVMAICSKAPVNSASFIEFIKVEKLRLLLLIKEELVEYFKKEFRSAAFMEVLQTRENTFMKRSIQHGLREYFEALYFITARIELKKQSNGNLDDLARDFKMLRFITKTIQCHFLSMNKIQYSHLSKRKTSEDIRELFHIIRVVPYLASNEIPLKDMEINIPDFKFDCHDVIMDLIIPELIVNMRKYALNCPGIKYMGIEKQDNMLVFTNSFDSEYRGQDLEKKFGGINMCNSILQKNLNLPKIDNAIKDNLYKTYLTLSK
ncbi:hypothetical protein ACFQZS_04090 [Mucilaginibacter calamicampi]|uniref:Uncharacterized protein n=1 Tax=Mucilaginibacter calamicampi TaxID=1302352 RepID=A0ABW2YSB9_9SPHI